MDRSFITPDFLLYNEKGKRLYHEIASSLPIIDYHSHLSASAIRANHRFANLAEAWLDGDHYKWRAMRANGVDESYCTGNQSPESRFMKWAETVPHTLRNPLYHWTHLELSRYFGEDRILSAETATDIYQNCSSLLQQPGFTVNDMLSKMSVELICTTDDPLDSLDDHNAINLSGKAIRVYPTFR
ncbi:MAG TPA: glucuronate isomerase, partial [Flavitalea sp.]|nr:glucuronate isomerase [Flavitalea sp.]